LHLVGVLFPHMTVMSLSTSLLQKISAAMDHVPNCVKMKIIANIQKVV